MDRPARLPAPLLALGAAALVAGILTVAHRSAGRGGELTQLMQDHPPTGDVAILPTNERIHDPAGEVVAWLSTNNDECDAILSFDALSPHMVGSCHPAASVLWSAGPAELPNKPVFRPMPNPGKVLAIGFVRGPADDVQLTLRGQTFTAQVVALTSDAGAYATVLPTPVNDGVAWSDITSVVARDAAGRAIASI